MDCLCPKYDEEYAKVLASEIVKQEEERNKVIVNNFAWHPL
jgi:hypothetical protein